MDASCSAHESPANKQRSVAVVTVQKSGTGKEGAGVGTDIARTGTWRVCRLPKPKTWFLPGGIVCAAAAVECKLRGPFPVTWMAEVRIRKVASCAQRARAPALASADQHKS